MECLSYCVAKSIDLNRLDTYFKKNNIGYESTKTLEVITVHSIQHSEQVIFIFKNGTIVSWGLKRHQFTHYLKLIKPYIDKPLPILVHDEFSYQYSDKTSIEPHGYFDVDCMTLEENTDELKLSLSYGFSQSVKLQYFETIIEALIEKYTPLIQHLSLTGKMPINRRQIQQVIGEILGAKSEMNLISNFMYHPKYFWQHPSLEGDYDMLERYMHIQRRVNAINHRLDTLNEIFEMCHGYLENRHAHYLEMIIIVLIGIEIIIGLIGFVR